MQFYGEDWCEIDGKIIEDLGSFVRVQFLNQNNPINVPKMFIQNAISSNERQSQKLLVPMSFLKRSRIISLKNNFLDSNRNKE